jgi:hypothetical protein
VKQSTLKFTYLSYIWTSLHTSVNIASCIWTSLHTLLFTVLIGVHAYMSLSIYTV